MDTGFWNGIVAAGNAGAASSAPPDVVAKTPFSRDPLTTYLGRVRTGCGRRERWLVPFLLPVSRFVGTCGLRRRVNFRRTYVQFCEEWRILPPSNGIHERESKTPAADPVDAAAVPLPGPTPRARRRRHRRQAWSAAMHHPPATGDPLLAIRSTQPRVNPPGLPPHPPARPAFAASHCEAARSPLGQTEYPAQGVGRRGAPPVP